MMIRIASENDIPALRALWAQCFHDPQEYINLFFSRRFAPEQTLLAEESGLPVSMLFLLEGTVCSPDGQRFSAWYIYAACTHPDYRRHGLMEQLLLQARRMALFRKIDCLTLLPSTQNLYDFYARFCFLPFFVHRVLHVSRRELYEKYHGAAGAYSARMNARQMKGLRQKALAGHAYFDWSEPSLAYALEEHFFTGGKAVCTAHGYILYARKGETALIQELCACPGGEAALAAALLNECDALSFTFWGSGENEMMRMGTEEQWGMLQPVSSAAMQIAAQAYLGLALS